MSSKQVKNYHPVKFLDQLEGNNHIVMLYDDEKYADLMIARYFLDGLEKGQSCIFFTDEPPENVEKRLSAQGIDVEKYKHANLLRVYFPGTTDRPNVDALTILKAIRSESTKGMRGPFRFVGRTIRDIESKDGMVLGMTVEKTGQDHFPEFDNSQLCYYDVSKMEHTQKDEWITQLMKNHHYVIYAADPRKAVAFEADLLEPEEE